MSNKLFIVGNGFDLHFHLPTTVSVFRQYLSTKRTYDGYNAADMLEGYGVDWGVYENSLSEMSIDDLAIDYIVYPDYMSDHESDRDGGIVNMELVLEELNRAVKDSLKEMVLHANEAIGHVPFSQSDGNLLEANSAIVNFNYTSTIERLYGADCFHIHGFFETGEELVFGYQKEMESGIERELNSDDEDDHDFYVDSQKELILKFYKSWKKRLKLKELSSYLNHFGAIDTIIVMGHSMSEVDAPYFELIEKQLHPTDWIVYWHDSVPNYSTYSFASRVNLVKW